MKNFIEELKKQRMRYLKFLLIDMVFLPLAIILVSQYYLESELLKRAYSFNLNSFLSTGMSIIIFHYLGYKLMYHETIKKIDVFIINIFVLISIVFFLDCFYYVWIDIKLNEFEKLFSTVIFATIPASAIFYKDMISEKIAHRGLEY